LHHLYVAYEQARPSTDIQKTFLSNSLANPPATIRVLVAANLFLILELAHPYIGEIATSPQPLRDVITVLSEPTT
jgi:hypothetical protein